MQVISVPLGSILGLLNFNIYVFDLFFFIEEENVTAFRDDTIPYFSNNNVVAVMQNIESKGKKKWEDSFYLVNNGLF